MRQYRNPNQSVTNRKNNTNRFKHLEAELDTLINKIKYYRFNKNIQVAIAKTKPFERFSSDVRFSKLEFFILLADRDAVKSIIAKMKQKELNDDDIEELAALKKLTSVLTKSHIEQLAEVKTWLHYNQKLSESYLNRHNPIGPSENYDHNLSELANGIKPDKLRYKTHQNLDILPDPNRTQYLNDCKTVIAEKIKANLTYIDSLISEFLTEKLKAPTQPPEPLIYINKEEKEENMFDQIMLDQIGRVINSVGKSIAGSQTRAPLTETQKDSPREEDQRVVVKRLVANIEEKSRQGNEKTIHSTNSRTSLYQAPAIRTTFLYEPAAIKATRPFRGTDKDYSENQINKALEEAKINSKKNKFIADPTRSNKIKWRDPVSRALTQSIIGSQHQDVARLLAMCAREDGVNPDSKPATPYLMP